MSIALLMAAGPGIAHAATLKPKPIEEMDVIHHFGSGMYIKETRFKAGDWGEKHTHSFDHLSVLVSGRIS